MHLLSERRCACDRDDGEGDAREGGLVPEEQRADTGHAVRSRGRSRLRTLSQAEGK